MGRGEGTFVSGGSSLGCLFAWIEIVCLRWVFVALCSCVRVVGSAGSLDFGCTKPFLAGWLDYDSM
jgi:hypothetical protein